MVNRDSYDLHRGVGQLVSQRLKAPRDKERLSPSGLQIGECLAVLGHLHTLTEGISQKVP